MKPYKRKETIVDSDGNLWFKFTNEDDTVGFKLASPCKEGVVLESPAVPYNNLKPHKFHRIRGEQWRENWYHEWDFKNKRYCTGKWFETPSETYKVCKTHKFQHHLDMIMVFHYGKVFFAEYYANSNSFRLYDVHTLESTKGWTNCKNIQPIYDIDNLKTAL